MKLRPRRNTRRVPATTAFLALALALGSAPLAAQVAQAPVARQAAIEQARRLVAGRMAELGSPGATVAVMINGELVWSEGFGLADIEQAVPAAPHTVFRIGSVSKPLTAAALGRLVEQGRLDLDREVQRYVPSFPVKRYPVTVRQLAGHLAGIRHYRQGEFANQRHYQTVNEGLAMFSGDSLLFEPGTRYQYSSYGWNLLSAVVEGASGMPFLTYMRDSVFQLAGLAQTYPEFADSIIPHRADFYAWVEPPGRMLNAPYVDNSYKWAGGGFLSTSEDLARFGDAILTHRLLRPETVALLWTSQQTRDGKPTGYGLGWSIVTEPGGRRRVGHTGGAMGGTASLQIYPEERLVIAMLVNSDRTFTRDAPRLAALFLEAPPR